MWDLRLYFWADSMRENTLATIKASIVEVLESRGVEMSADELLKELKAKGITDAGQIKAAMWALVAESAVELTPTYMLKTGASLLTAA